MKQYYILREGDLQEGPIDEVSLKKQLKDGAISGSTKVWCEGMQEWESANKVFNNNTHLPPPPKPIVYSAKSKAEMAQDLINSATGLSKIDGFSFKSFFSELFKKHSNDDVVRLFCRGTKETTPALDAVAATWPTPWVFSRLLLACVLLYFGFGWALETYKNANLIPGYIFVGSFGMPLCIMVLFYELNIRQDMSFYEAVKAMVFGGLLSLILALFLFDKVDLEGAYWAGPIEEPAKLLAALFICDKTHRDGRILHGLLIGAAAGAGFAAFESAGYVFRYMSEDVMETRAIWSPLGHVVWTAITAGAYWHVMGLKIQEGKRAKDATNIDFSIFGDMRFWRIAIIPVVLHMLWNSLLLGEYHNYVWIGTGVLAWFIALGLVQAGINQIKREKVAMFADQSGGTEADASEQEESA